MMPTLSVDQALAMQIGELVIKTIAFSVENEDLKKKVANLSSALEESKNVNATPLKEGV